MAFATSKTTVCVCAYCAAGMDGELFRNLSEKLPAVGACPCHWSRAFFEVEPGLAAVQNRKGLLFSSNPLKSGGEGEIRTPGTLLTYTRFPIVLLRPARTPLHSVNNHRSKPNTCIAASKELQAKKSNMGRLLQFFLSAGGQQRPPAVIVRKCLRAKRAWVRQPGECLPAGCSPPSPC